MGFDVLCGLFDGYCLLRQMINVQTAHIYRSNGNQAFVSYSDHVFARKQFISLLCNELTCSHIFFPQKYINSVK